MSTPLPGQRKGKIFTTSDVDKDMEKLDCLYFACGDLNWYHHPGKVWQLSKNIRHAIITQLRNYTPWPFFPQGNKNLRPHKKSCTPVQLQDLQGGAAENHLLASTEDAGYAGSIPGSGRSPREGNGNPLQVFCPGKFHEQRSLAGNSPWRCKESDKTEAANTHTFAQFIHAIA